uniref:PH domain-containing protein n=1 Tax=Panagrolaimus sp. JU765 TaxID=591449 RepID=A0AC34QTH0_9BILA
MEDDNATDIIKWLFRDDTQVDLAGDLRLKHDGSFINCEARLKGNLLAVKTVEAVLEPILVVCEKIRLETEVENNRTFILTYGDNHRLHFEGADNKVRELWILKIAMASHQIVRAGLDEVTHQYLQLFYIFFQ